MPAHPNIIGLTPEEATKLAAELRTQGYDPQYEIHRTWDGRRTFIVVTYKSGPLTIKKGS